MLNVIFTIAYLFLTSCLFAGIYYLVYKFADGASISAVICLILGIGLVCFLVDPLTGLLLSTFLMSGINKEV